MDLTRGKIICDDDDEPHCDSQTQKGEGSCKKARSDSPFEEEGIRKGSATRPNFLKVSFFISYLNKLCYVYYKPLTRIFSFECPCTTPWFFFPL